MGKAFLLALAGSSLTAIVAASPAAAQNTQQQRPPATQGAQPAADDDDEEIIITGTQIRGVEPIGSNATGLSNEEIRSTGLTDSNQILGQLPQSNFFLALPEPGGGVIGAGTPRVPLSRPNLRNLPLGGATSGALTLVLMDGHRIVPGGIEQSIVDAGIVPTSMLDRFEAILDGASAVYGSDAVGGVINYITRKRFDGAEVSARYGFGGDYWQMDTSVTLGTTWGTGGISLNYEFAKSSNILNGERGSETPYNWINPRDPITGVPTAGGPPAIDGITCDVANIRQGTAGTTNPVQAHVSGSGLAAGPEFCATNAFETFTPAQRRHSVFAVLQQDLGDWLKFDVTGFYSNRLQEANEGPFRAAGAIIRPFTTNGLPNGPANPGGNPFFRCGGAVSCTAAHRVEFSYGPAFGNDSQFTDTTTKIWQITPTLTAELGGDWQVRGQFSYGKSHVTVEQDRVNTVLQSIYLTGSSNSTTGPFPAQPLTPATAINPYDIASSSRTLLDSLVWRNRRDGVHEMMDARIVADGPVFTLPGGDVRVAVGLEWMDLDFKKRTTLAPSVIPGNPFAATPAILQPYVSGKVKSKSAFAEIVVPVFGPDNATPGLDHLTLSASARYDDYGDSGGGDTFNPKFAVTYGPFDWITFRANWGTSFRAPNGADKAGQAGPTATVVPGTLINNVLDPVTGLRLISPATGQPYPCFIAGSGGCTSGPSNVQSNFITLGGTDPNLKPESSTNWAIGADISPPFVSNLTFSATYWHIKFDDIISLPLTSVGQLYPLFAYIPDKVVFCRDGSTGGTNPATGVTTFTSPNPCAPGGPLNAAAQAFVSAVPGGLAALNTAFAAGDLAYITDPRTTNLGIAKVSGIDASVTYRHEFDKGSLDFSISGARVLTADVSIAPGAPFVDNLEFDTPRFRMTARFGATMGGFRFQTTFRHQSGFTPNPGTNRSPSQTHIGAFDVIDLAFTYDFDGTDILTRDLQLSLNINNVTGADPVLNRTAGGGSINGQTLGRVVQFGFLKKF